MNTAQKISTMKDTNSEVPEYLVPDQLFSETPTDSMPINTEKNIPNPTAFAADFSVKAPQYAIASPFMKPLDGKFKLLQLWEGRIVKIGEDQFTAIISDKTNPDLNDELVTLDIDEISPDDIQIAKEGSVFYWSIGYADYPGRGRIRESKIRFRRLPGWSKEEINKAMEVGKRLAEFFQTD